MKLQYYCIVQQPKHC